MRIVQIIDSLEPGGAERMAVNYANVLSKKIEFSGLVTSRKEGLLVNQIDKSVSYLFLKKKKKIDLGAVFRLRKYLKENKVDLVHAHSSSFFSVVLVKLILPKIKIIWHDHYGISQDLSSRKNISLKLGSLFFTGIISVNSALRDWAKSYLWCSNIIYFPNFILDSSISNEKINLNGSEGKRIICVANLRPQKNHILLINAAKVIKDKFPDWTFHLFGKDFNDSYSDQLKKRVKDLQLQNTVYFYGTTNNVNASLLQCQIAVLPSLSEGLPLAILEYGLNKLPVIATNVGEISKIIISEKEGIMIESNNCNELVTAIENLIESEKFRNDLGLNLFNKVQKDFSAETILSNYILWLKSLSTFTV
ncbi:glycosyltransferase [Flavobacterium sp. KBS0721]|uniref:glycosyltransferase n=1 Tax=Flavobacterium sp. KBS0721 TaxID=1179672 RepID=UPI00098FBA3C|nr:glycosyltransferase [Flavobacterium sp. KBS0721]QDW18835.1 glycosyltransferase [Flavobacterium sp. KBS0721]